MTSTTDEVARARNLIAEASFVLVLTGAGISADSGVPTFRGLGGLWQDYRAEDLATPEAFARDPRLVWEWYGLRREAVAACEPNSAHRALAKWQRWDERVVIATQNVDGLHAQACHAAAASEGSLAPAGSVDRDVLLEIHGTLFRVRCLRCGARRDHRDPIDASSNDSLPRCEDCGGRLRPDVIWFGEALDATVLERAFGWAEQAGVCLVIGTSAVVQPAVSLATVTRETGGRIIEVNPERTPLTDLADVSIRGGAAMVVPDLVPISL